MYPIALDLQERLVVVVGGGSVAERKVRGLLRAGARVRVVAAQANEGLRAAAERHEIELCERPYRHGDVDGAVLAYAATDDDDVNALVARDARARGVLVDDASNRERSDFSTPLAHHVGPLTFAIDTGGRSPSFARRLLAEVRDRFDERYASAARTLFHAREYAKVVLPPADRGSVMASLAGRDIDELAALNRAEVEHEVDAVYAALRGPSCGTSEDQRVTRESDRTADMLRQNGAGRALIAATRGSALALWQTRHVAAVLARAGIVSTTLPLATRADRVQDRALAALGSDGVFVKELEAALREGRADYAVHSCKDLPSTLPTDMHLAAIGPRADPRDAFCSERYATFDALPPRAIVGTSSPRRRAQLQARRPDLVFEIIRGNVETRLRKLREGKFDAIVLALAGLERLGLRAAYTVAFSPDVVVPAVGQGALALETRAADDALAQRLHAAFADPATELAVAAERAFLRTCRGGCQAPVGAYATYADGILSLHAVIAEPAGRHVVVGELGGDARHRDECERLGAELAQRLLAQGGEAILAAAVDERAPGPPADQVRPQEAAPLSGRVFLLPRTQDRVSTIAPAFERAGARVVEARDGSAAAAAFSERPPDALLFPSSGSVQAALPYLASLRAAGARPIVAAMGDASAAAARAVGFPPDVVATEPTAAAFVQSVTRYLIERGDRWRS
ncbi:MAG: hydroxymethylbilane synthase [Candidatus Eremiobacteraeota bacterium]|nr:hydroxymethylbilane synthase [Candidatus Eremiobacteraeota bacterium]